MHPDGLLQRCEPVHEILLMPQQTAGRQCQPPLGPLPLEGPHRPALPVHLQQELHPHAQPVAGPPEQRRRQPRLHRGRPLAAGLRALAGRPIAGPPDAPPVAAHLHFDPLADRHPVPLEGPPAHPPLRRQVPLLQLGPRHPRMRGRSRLPAPRPPARPTRPRTRLARIPLRRPLLTPRTKGRPQQIRPIRGLSGRRLL